MKEKPFDLGENSLCNECQERLCFCSGRKEDGSWQPFIIDDIKKSIFGRKKKWSPPLNEPTNTTHFAIQDGNNYPHKIIIEDKT